MSYETDRAKLRRSFPGLSIVFSRHDRNLPREQRRSMVYFKGVRLPDPFLQPTAFSQAYAAAKRGEPVPEFERLTSPRSKAPKSVVQRQIARAPKTGVYLLFLEQAVVYIGASLDMPERVKTHRVNGRPFDRAYFIATLPTERFAVEKALIAAFNPPQNWVGRATNGNVAGTQISKFDPAVLQIAKPTPCKSWESAT